MKTLSIGRPALLECIGNTPLLPLKLPGGASPRVEIWAKAEWFNPGGSVKDRAAFFITQDAIARGLLRDGKTLLDATSGNTGIAYAMLGAAQGFAVELCMPANVSAERKRIVRAYGAALTLTDPLEGSDGAILKARALVAANPERYYYADQYNNPNNWRAHYETTAPEIWRQTGGRITHFVAAIGTSGTLMGTAKRLREYNPAIQIVEVEPADELQIIEGLKHMASAIVPGIYDAHLADRKISVEAEAAYETAREVARDEGYLVGFSSGAAIYAARRLADELDAGVIVTVMPDSGERYLGLSAWDE